ncbi:MAG: F0F1 ATP synthase subunit epsilon [Deltaproteobacteria bacterium]|jgi:F-type H+-transporting ATPase subunit epsilon|nr:F0F1 ATP synthase subunit epsilon [Deltaproteobacteria bacterium]MCW8892825.1 F0F1 ATP synthase subunit epsilon [Deltaproteobacteria bacterium]MCW9050625.1 F0F1 ATP synthase subunit epsilon [Deltaproteobacteria bacterium]
MADKLKLEMVTPYKRVLAEEVDEITAPGFVGELGILPGHTPLLTTLRVGELSYKKGNEQFHVVVNWGYLEVEEDTVTVLVDTAEKSDEIDLARAKAALGRAEDALKTLPHEDKKYAIMEAALQRALIRIQVADKNR